MLTPWRKIFLLLLAVAPLAACKLEPLPERRGGNSKVKSADADTLAAFQKTLLPLLRSRCAGQCHGVQQTPTFAVGNDELAHKAFVDAQVVSVETPENSRLVKRLAADSHNCWSTCADNGSEMLAAVKEFIGAVPSRAPSAPAKTSGAQGFSATDPQGVIRFNLENLLGKPGLLAMDIKQLDAGGFQVKDPRLENLSAAVKIRGMKVLVNGQFDARNGTFLEANTTVAAPGGLLFGRSPTTMIILYDKGPAMDQLSLSFEELENLEAK